MDADTSPSSGRAPSHRGGTVEPADRATIAKDLAHARARHPIEVPGERYELRKPSEEVTYRSNRIADIIAKADQVESDRFVAIDTDGKRTTVQRVRGVQGEPEMSWQRGPQRPAAPGRPLEPLLTRDVVPDVSSRDALTKAGPAPAPARQSPELPKSVDVRADAGPDAKTERAALVARLETDLQDRYVIKRAPLSLGDLSVGRTEYRFRGNTSRVAFTESTFRLATDDNSPFVARSMVDVAEARNWKALRVSGHEEFRRRVWFEASLRGVKTIGYEPMSSDMAWLRSERDARQLNRIELRRDATSDKAATTTTTAQKGSARGGGGRKAVLAAIEAVLIAKNVPEKKREAVIAAATEKLAERARAGRAPSVKVYDRAAPSQRPVVVPVPDAQRTRDRAAPVR